MLPCHFTFPIPFPTYPPFTLSRNRFCPSSITSAPIFPHPLNRCFHSPQTDVGDIDRPTSGTSVERLWRRDKTRRGDAPVGAPPLQSWCQVWFYLISMCRVSLAFSSSVFFGMLMVRTPSAMPAEIFDFSTFSGSENLCSNLL